MDSFTHSADLKPDTHSNRNSYPYQDRHPYSVALADIHTLTYPHSDF